MYNFITHVVHWAYNSPRDSQIENRNQNENINTLKWSSKSIVSTATYCFAESQFCTSIFLFGLALLAVEVTVQLKSRDNSDNTIVIGLQFWNVAKANFKTFTNIYAIPVQKCTRFKLSCRQFCMMYCNVNYIFSSM